MFSAEVFLLSWSEAAEAYVFLVPSWFLLGFFFGLWTERRASPFTVTTTPYLLTLNNEQDIEQDN